MRALLAVSLYLCLRGSAAPVSLLERAVPYGHEGPPYEVGGAGAHLPQEVNVPFEIDLLPDGERLPMENPETTLPEGLPPAEGELPNEIPGEHTPEMPVPEGLPPAEGNGPQLPGVENPETSVPGGAEGLAPPASEAPQERPSIWKDKSPEDIKSFWLNGLPETRVANWENSPVHEIWNLLSREERFSLVFENPDAKKWPYLTPEQRLYLWQERPILKSRDNQRLWALLTPEQREKYWKQDPKRWQNLTPQDQETVVQSVRQNPIFEGLANEEIRRIVEKIDKLAPKDRLALSNSRIEKMKEAVIKALAEESKQLATEAGKVAKAEEEENSVGR